MSLTLVWLTPPSTPITEEKMIEAVIIKLFRKDSRTNGATFCQVIISRH